MRRTWISFFIFLVILIISTAGSANAQSPLPNDSSASTAFAQMSAATGWLAGRIPQDAVATGAVIRYHGDSQDTANVTFKARGTSEFRSDLADATGTRTFIANGDTAAVTTLDGTQLIPSNSGLATRSWVFPFFSTLVFASGTGFTFQNSGTETVNGQPCLRIEMSPQSIQSDPTSNYRLQAGILTLWIAVSTGMPIQVSYMRVADGNPTAMMQCTRQFSDWRAVGGVAIPFHQDEYMGTQHLLSLQLNLVTVNNGLTDNDFTLPEVQQ